MPTIDQQQLPQELPMNAGQFAKKHAAIFRRAGGRAQFVRKALAHLVREANAVPMHAGGGKLLGYRMPGGSVVCVKKRYRDGETARVELARIAKYASHEHVPVRVYRCEFCAGFHLTSKA